MIRSSDRRAGSGLIEVLVVIAVIGLVALILLLTLTRSRETARTFRCMSNLRQIGEAVALYEQSTRRLPPIAAFDVPDEEAAGPLAVLLGHFGTLDLQGLSEETAREEAAGAGVEVLVGYQPGFVCPADPIATSRSFPAPASYRANTGATTTGDGGPFAPGAVVRSGAVEAGDGAAYTAGFGERLVGSDGRSPQPGRDYHEVPGPIGTGGCPPATASALRTDAGRSWAERTWRSTLYSHAVPPDGRDACIAEGGRTAAITAASGHVGGLHLLLMDGRVVSYTPTVAPPVWAALGGYRDAEAARP